MTKRLPDDDEHPGRLPEEDRVKGLEIRKDFKTKEGELTLKKEDNELERNKWRGRRKMGWVSLISMLIVTVLLLFGPIDPERLKTLSQPITWFYFAMTSIIGAYMGFTTWASKK